MTLAIGLVIIILSVLGGYSALGGKVSVLWQPYEIVIICGAAIGAFIIANPGRVIGETGKQLGELALGKRMRRNDHLDMLSLMFALVRQMKSKGVAAIENDIEHPEDSELFQRFPRALKQKRMMEFLTDYLRLIALGSERPHELEALMDEEIETLTKQNKRIIKAVEGMSDTLPALGIVAAVLGVIKAMGYINQSPEVLGSMIGGALVGTFLGVVLAYCLVNPLAAAMKERAEQHIAGFVSIKAALIAYLNGAPPQIAVEFARKVLFDEVQPTFDELEAATRPVPPGANASETKKAA